MGAGGIVSPALCMKAVGVVKMHEGPRLWLALMGLMNLVDGTTFLLVRASTALTAYDWATELLPRRGWGSLFLILGMASLWLRSKPNSLAIRLVITIQVVAMFVFATSIAVLSLSGVESAFVGAGKWATYGMLGLWILHRPIVEVSP